MTDVFVIHHMLDSSPLEYKKLKASYTALREKWNINELISVHVQEEDRLNREKAKTAHLTLIAQARKLTVTAKRFKL